MKKLPSGAAVEIFESLPSTNLEAKNRIEAGAAGPAWLIAQEQTAGVGRRGREWRQAIGDFAGTLYLFPDFDIAAFGQVSFVVAVAVADAIEAVAPIAGAELKWPNDILLDGGKVSGILLETTEHQGRHALVIGIGVNIVSKPQGVDYRATRLIDHSAGEAPGIAQLAAAIDERFWRLLQHYRENGFLPIRAAWLERAVGLGETITVRLPNEEISGIFEDLDENGALILRNDAGSRIISAGDVFFGHRGPSNAARD